MFRRKPPELVAVVAAPSRPGYPIFGGPLDGQFVNFDRADVERLNHFTHVSVDTPAVKQAVTSYAGHPEPCPVVEHKYTKRGIQTRPDADYYVVEYGFYYAGIQR